MNDLRKLNGFVGCVYFEASKFKPMISSSGTKDSMSPVLTGFGTVASMSPEVPPCHPGNGNDEKTKQWQYLTPNHGPSEFKAASAPSPPNFRTLAWLVNDSGASPLERQDWRWNLPTRGGSSTKRSLSPPQSQNHNHPSLDKSTMEIHESMKGWFQDMLVECADGHWIWVASMRERSRCLQCLLQILQALTPGWPLPLMMGKDTRNAHTYFCTTEKPIQGPCFFQWPCVLCVCVRVSVILYKVSSSVPKTITVVAAISEALEHWSPQSIFQINGGRTAFSRSREPKMFIRIKIQTLHEWTKNQKNYIQTTCTPQIAFPKSSWHSQTFTQNSSKTTPQRPSPSRPPRSWRV